MDAQRRRAYDMQLLHLLDVEVRRARARRWVARGWDSGRRPPAGTPPQRRRARRSAAAAGNRSKHPRPRQAQRVRISPVLPAPSPPPPKKPQEYLSRFHELVLTVNGLDMALPRSHRDAAGAGQGPPPEQQQLLVATPGSRMLKAS
jgi:hypothetical protein